MNAPENIIVLPRSEALSMIGKGFRFVILEGQDWSFQDKHDLKRGSLIVELDESQCLSLGYILNPTKGD